MSNLAKIYSDATGKTELAKLRAQKAQEEGSNEISPFGAKSPSPAADALTIQTKIDWLASPVTQDLFKSLTTEYSELIANAIAGAVAYPVHGNHQQIVQWLVRANTIKTILDTNARPNRPD